MEFGASIFFTDYSISPAELAVALEERGFDSLWAAEHSHIPVPRRTPAPGGGELPKRYYDVMDPFVTLTRCGGGHQAAQGRDRRLSGDPARHDPDRQARRLDRPGLGRAVSVRHRRRLERRGDREPRHRIRRPLQKDARADRGDEGDLDQVEGGVPRRHRQFHGDDDLAQASAEAAPAGHPRRRLSVGGAPRDPLRRRLVPERQQRQPARIPAALPADGRGGRARPAVFGGDAWAARRRIRTC